MVSSNEQDERRPSRVLKRVTSREEQDKENMLYWRSVSSQERQTAVFELTRSAYLGKGFTMEELQRPNRTVKRLRRLPS